MKANPPLRFWSALTAALLFVAGTASAQSLDYQNYNAIIFNDLSTTSDIEGRTFVGGNFTGGNSANLAIHLSPTVLPFDRTFVVGGNLSSGNPLNLQRGSLYIGGSTNGRAINYNGGGTTVADAGIGASLNSIRDYSLAQSAALQSLTVDSTVSLPSGQPGPTKFFATAGADGLAVFNVNGNSLFNSAFGQQFELLPDISTNSVVINVSGTSINWTAGNMVGNFTSNYWQGHILWNFYEATSINLGSRQFNGGILAPLASITTAGNIDGLVVANNLTTTAEVHLPDSNSPGQYAFEGYTAPVPEPGSAMLFLAAAGFILVVRNRRLLR